MKHGASRLVQPCRTPVPTRTSQGSDVPGGFTLEREWHVERCTRGNSVSYRNLQASGMAELDALREGREQRTARLLDTAAEFLAARVPELANEPHAVMAVLECREQGLPASMVPDVARQLEERWS